MISHWLGSTQKYKTMRRNGLKLLRFFLLVIFSKVGQLIALLLLRCRRVQGPFARFTFLPKQIKTSTHTHTPQKDTKIIKKTEGYKLIRTELLLVHLTQK